MGYGTKDFMSKVRTGGFGKMSDWKKRGKTVGWIHLDGFRERKTHNMMITKFKTKEGKEGYGMRMFTCPGGACPLCALVEFAKDAAEGLGEDKDFQVLYRSIKAKEKRDPDRVVSYSMKELAGKGDWRHKMFANPEFLFGWVPRDNRNSETPVEVMQATTGLASAIKRVIQSQIDDRGERNGDPLVKPYAMKFTYNKDALPAQMYNAERVDGDLAPLEEDVLEILRTPMVEFGADLDKMVQPSSRAEIMDAIGDCWDEDCPVAFEEFHDFYRSVAGGDEDGRTEREKKMEKATTRRDQMHGRKRVDDESTDEGVDEGVGGDDMDGEGGDEDPVSPKTSRRPVRSSVKEDESPRSSRRPSAADRRSGFSVDEVSPDLEDDEPPKSSRRRAAEPEPEEAPRPARRRAAEPEPEEPKKGKMVACPTCGEKVQPTKFGKCPSCAEELDVPF
jgi:hypothetical protein